VRTRRTVSQATEKLLPFRFEQEPLAADSPLRFLPNVILTSHSASVSKRSLDLLQIQAPKLPAISCRARGRQGRWSRDQPQCGWWTPCQHRRNDCMPYSSRFQNRGAIVTGTAGGIRRAIAARFAAEGREGQPLARRIGHSVSFDLVGQQSPGNLPYVFLHSAEGPKL